MWHKLVAVARGTTPSVFILLVVEVLYIILKEAVLSKICMYTSSPTARVANKPRVYCFLGVIPVKLDIKVDVVVDVAVDGDVDIRPRGFILKPFRVWLLL
mmetsp:Transcript_16290/g.18591  ORF Transcript_16290/g.18591 Transcript_16290/m.18591 type:complete len:100 (-) Transcript_16290:54-353(-)